MTGVPATLGLRHLALFVPNECFERTVAFYRDVMGLVIDWQPDDDNVYLTSGHDNLALHRAAADRPVNYSQSPLDHLGFCVPHPEDVHAWCTRITMSRDDSGAEILKPVRTHRDGATSFYFRDPAGHTVQILHIPLLKA